MSKAREALEKANEASDERCIDERYVFRCIIDCLSALIDEHEGEKLRAVSVVPLKVESLCEKCGNYGIACRCVYTKRDGVTEINSNVPLSKRKDALPCPHSKVHRIPDPSGNNDTDYRCDLCRQYVSRAVYELAALKEIEARTPTPPLNLDEREGGEKISSRVGYDNPCPKCGGMKWNTYTNIDGSGWWKCGLCDVVENPTPTPPPTRGEVVAEKMVKLSGRVFELWSMRSLGNKTVLMLDKECFDVVATRTMMRSDIAYAIDAERAAAVADATDELVKGVDAALWCIEYRTTPANTPHCTAAGSTAISRGWCDKVYATHAKAVAERVVPGDDEIVDIASELLAEQQGPIGASLLKAFYIRFARRVLAFGATPPGATS